MEEDMRLFRVIILLTSFLFLANCTATAGGSHTLSLKETEGHFIDINKAPLNLDNEIIGVAPGFLWNASQFLRFNLNKEEKLMHRSAVYHALNNTKNGEVTKWYGKDRNSAGVVRVIHSYPESRGYCRVYQSFIKLNGATRHMTNNACMHGGYNIWRFVK